MQYVAIPVLGFTDGADPQSRHMWKETTSGNKKSSAEKEQKVSVKILINPVVGVPTDNRGQ